MRKELKAKYNTANKEWYLEVDLINLTLVMTFLKKYGFEEVNGFTLERECEIKKKPIDEVISKRDIEDLLPELQLKRVPRNYQIDALYYMMNHGNCINGSDCGTGKTTITICYCEFLDTFPALIVCPSSVKSGWKREWSRCNPNRKVTIINSTNKEIDIDSDVYVINYDILGNKDKETGDLKIKFQELLKIKFQLMVGDEIHFLKNDKALRSKAFVKIAKHIPTILGLSGTLILNRPEELINILKVIDRFKEIFPDENYYRLRYCNAKYTQFGWNTKDACNMKELNDILTHYCYFRKEKRDVLLELPPINDELIECNINNKKIYREAEKDLIEFLSLADEEKVDAALRAEHLVKLNLLKKLSIEGKTKDIISFIKDWCESNEDEKVVVFGCLKEPLKELHKKFSNSRLITGETLSKKRDEILESFKTDPKIQILFANIQCIGTGVDGLQEVCSNAMIIELPNKSTDLSQAVSRLERDGQRSSINIYYLLSRETIDEKSWEFLKEKKSVTDIVNRGIEDDFSLALINSYRPR
jgi:SWI/SNF-related matrix-associated actin-dependent regulator 1 of chromatin subfamily A